jgi:hypothetical protein
LGVAPRSVLGQTRRTPTITWKEWSETSREIPTLGPSERMLVCLSTKESEHGILAGSSLLLQKTCRQWTVGDEGGRRRASGDITDIQPIRALGLTPIHVNRTLRQLREHKLLTVRKGIVTILPTRTAADGMRVKEAEELPDKPVHGGLGPRA